jgi:hypothetical protein
VLVDEVGFPPEDIIFDPNIFAIATGIEEHDYYAVDFINATRWIKQNLPGAKVSGGVSNVSFSFRGNDPVREAIHTVFLYHAIQAGMDMGIVNAGMVGVYDDLEATLRERVEDVVLNRTPQYKDGEEQLTPGERLIEVAESAKGAAKDDSAKLAWRGTADAPVSVAHKLSHALVHGITDFINEDTEAAYQEVLAKGGHERVTDYGAVIEESLATLLRDGVIGSVEDIAAARAQLDLRLVLTAPTLEPLLVPGHLKVERAHQDRHDAEREDEREKEQAPSARPRLDRLRRPLEVTKLQVHRATVVGSTSRSISTTWSAAATA